MIAHSDWKYQASWSFKQAWEKHVYNPPESQFINLNHSSDMNTACRTLHLLPITGTDILDNIHAGEWKVDTVVS